MTTVPIIFSVNYSSVLYLQHNPESISNINILIKRYWGLYLHSPDGNIRKSGLCLTKDGVDRKQSGMAFPWPAVSTANMNMYVCVCPQCSHLDIQPKILPLPFLQLLAGFLQHFFSCLLLVSASLGLDCFFLLCMSPSVIFECISFVSLRHSCLFICK